MKTFVINLKDRKDRIKKFKHLNDDFISYEIFNAINGYTISHTKLLRDGFDIDNNWIDPILNTKLTKGEVGCFLSHWKIWEECIRLNEPVLILEDDAIITENFSYDELYKIKKQQYNLIYLGWEEMDYNEHIVIDNKFIIPKLPYWTLAYMVTPESAKILLDNNIKKNIIPVDEYLLRMMKKLRPIGYKENVVISKHESSNTSSKNCYDYYIDFNVHALTVGTDESKCSKLYESANHSNIQFTNIGKDIEWYGGVMENGKGGGHKVNLLREHLKTLPDNDVVLFCDGYDVFVNAKIEEFISRYLSFNKKVVFAAEKYCWPDDTLAKSMEELTLKQHEGLDTPYKYLNSGVFMGRVSELKNIINSEIEDCDDDQFYYQKKWLSEEYDIIIDTDCYMFQCHEPEVSKGNNGMLYNPITKCYNICYHGNGGDEAKLKFNHLYASFYMKKYTDILDNIQPPSGFLFPTPFWTFKNPLPKGAYEWCLEMQRLNQSVFHSNVNGYHSPSSTDWNAFPYFKYFQDTLINFPPFTFDCWWVNVQKKGDFNMSHTHPRSDLAGIWFITDNNQTTEFTSPFSHERYTLYKAWKNDDLSLDNLIDCKAGDMIIFPSDLLHNVKPHKLDTPRISISFNMSLIY